jgi:hypothetical protein
VKVIGRKSIDPDWEKVAKAKTSKGEESPQQSN